MQFLKGESADTLGLSGKEQFSIDLGASIKPGQQVTVQVQGNDKVQSFQAVLRFDTEVEIEYYKYGGVLQLVLANKAKQL